jgi:hypothetical protein
VPRQSVSATHIFQAFCELCLDVPENVTDYSLGGCIVPGIQGRGVRKGEGNGLMLASFGKVQVNVEGDGTDVRSVASTSLDELGDGRELVLRGG